MKPQFTETSVAFTMLFHVMRTIETLIKEECSLSETQARILFAVELQGEEMHMSDIANLLDIKLNTATVAVSQLEEKGLIVREDDLDDYRIVHVLVTPEGKVKSECIENVLKKALDMCFGQPGKIWSEQGTVSETGYTRIYNAILADDKADGLIFFLWQHYHASKQNFSSYAKQEGLSINEFRVLLESSNYPHGVSPSDLSLSLMLKMADIANAIKALTKRKLIMRRRSENDRRSIIVEISNEGFTLLERTVLDLRESVREHSLTRGGSERKALNDLADHYTVLMRKSFRKA